MKKALLINRQIVRHATVYMYALGCCLSVIMGVSRVANSPATLDMSRWPLWCGHLFLYGGLVLLLAFFIDKVVIGLFGIFKPYKKHNTLQDRIKLAELH